MRKILAAAVLATAAFGTGTASAGCWGVEDAATLCYDGQPGVNQTERSVCVYTGGDTCEEHEYPWVTVDVPSNFSVCIGNKPLCAYPL